MRNYCTPLKRRRNLADYLPRRKPVQKRSQLEFEKVKADKRLIYIMYRTYKIEILLVYHLNDSAKTNIIQTVDSYNKQCNFISNSISILH